MDGLWMVQQTIAIGKLDEASAVGRKRFWRPPRIVEFDAASVVLHDETPKAPAGDDLARIMQDLPAETTCRH
jgi:hypothetical protein